MTDIPELSVVIPIYDEEEVIAPLVKRLRPVLDAEGVAYEVVAVDDGSRDTTPIKLQAARRAWPQLRVVRLRVNAGHQAAISAGLVAAKGDLVITMDADLQDPPETIPEMLAAARAHEVDVVQAVRNDRTTDTAFKRATARLFYRLVSLLAPARTTADAGDFRLMSRATVEAVNALPEHHRVLRFLIPELGFPTATVQYARQSRVAGVTKFPLRKMLTLSMDSVTALSTAPLRVATLAGVLAGAAGMLMMIYILIASQNGQTVAGWASTVVIMCAFGSVQLVCLGVIGEYLARMYVHAQGRPTYYVAYDSAHVIGTDDPEIPAFLDRDTR